MTEAHALILDRDDPVLGAVALKLSQLGFAVHYTPWLDEGLLLVKQEEGRIRAILVPPDIELEKARAVQQAGARLADEHSVPLVVIGPEPNEAARAQLAEAGAAWALWEPVDDAALRFVLNGAITLPSELSPRKEPRAPVNLICWMRTGEASTSGVLYSLSSRGAFLEISPPPAVGTEVALEFAMGGETVLTKARILYANAKGSGRASHLPLGAGLLFTDIDPSTQGRIRGFVKERAKRFMI
jgi:hypothetical protein